MKSADVGITESDPLRFFVLGDHGGVKDPAPQSAVVKAMATIKTPNFGLSVGDIAYFNGDPLEYVPQWYEPMAGLKFPWVSFPGNHDGDGTDGVTGSGVASWMANWATKSPEPPPNDQMLEYGRHTQTLPWVDWTLDTAAVTIIALYSNVPSGGHFEQSQIDWLTQELKAADAKKPVIVGMHHPPYSIDAHHGGSKKMGDALDKAMKASGRAVDLVLSGHVHDCQRFTRDYQGKHIPYIVSGNGGYHHLHGLAPGVVFEYGDDKEFGFWIMEVSGGKITGEYVGVTPGAAINLPPKITSKKDKF